MKKPDSEMSRMNEHGMERLMAEEKNLYLVAMGTKGGTAAGFRQWVAEKYSDPEKLADALAVFQIAH